MACVGLSFRTTSTFACAALLVAIAGGYLAGPAPDPAPIADTGGAVSFDPCMMWEQISAGVCFAVLVAVVACPFFTIQGFGNRSGPRWLAVAGLLAFTNVGLSNWWRVAAGCYTALSLTLEALWLCAMVAMLAHHAAARHGPSQPYVALPPQSQFDRIADRVFAKLVHLLLVLSVLDQALVLSTRLDDRTTSAFAIVNEIRRFIILGSVAAVPLGVIAGLRWLVVQTQRAST